MQGTITSYSRKKGTGLIKGRAGRLYNFGLFEWESSQIAPAPDMKVFFSSKDGAKHVACKIKPANPFRDAH